MEERGDSVSRRGLVQGLIAAGAAGVLGLPAKDLGAEPPLETTRLTLHHSLSICQAPLYVAEELLRAEGFTEVKYMTLEESGGVYKALGSGAVDVMNDFAPVVLTELDKESPIVTLGGLHVGCFQLIGSDRVRAIRDLKGKSVAVRGLGTPPYLFLASMLAYVGLNPRTDITWLTLPSADAMQRLAEGKVDALMGFPPEPQELRARKIGHVVVDSSRDRPWSQYFCCMTVANREFARKHPIATKRALRAFMKANDICTSQPDRAARTLVAKGVTKRADYALQTMTDVPYDKWRQFDPEDTMRFYALRLHETGMIKSTPKKLIAQGVDWRFLNELKRELKG
jgi:NitT/TauT family transport system substrate-binding protein